MIGFIIAAWLITLFSLALLIRPLLKTKNTVSYKREAQNIHYAKERLQELEEQLKNTSISATDYEALKLEIESTLAEDIELNNNNTDNNTEEAYQDETALNRSNLKLIALLCMAIPLGGLITYKLVGYPDALSLAKGKERAQQTTKKDIDLMISTIEQRLKDNPDDAEGWQVMARTYLALGQYQKSIDANLKLLSLNGADANVYAQLADASALLAQGDLAGQPIEYVNKALSLNNKQPQALWLAGLGSAQNGDTIKAREYWETLLPLLDNSPQQQQELTEIIQQTFDQETKNSINSTATQQKITQQKVTQQKVAEKAVAQQKSKQVDSNPEGIKLLITLADSVREKTEANETVFVFARAKDGPPAPLAVKPLLVSDLPAEVTLSDDNAMMPQLKLSLFEEVVVSARIAKSGNPVAQPGDIQSKLIRTANNTKETIKLEISEVLQ